MLSAVEHGAHRSKRAALENRAQTPTPREQQKKREASDASPHREKNSGCADLRSDGGGNSVSVIQAGPCPIVQVKTPETDGYSAIQIGFGKRRKTVSGNPGGSFQARVRCSVQGAQGGPRCQRRRVQGRRRAQRQDLRGIDGWMWRRVEGEGLRGNDQEAQFPARSGNPRVQKRPRARIGGQNTTPARILKGKRLPGRLAA